MAIYRGPGGSGDATQDAASEVLLAVQAKDAAIAAQVAAEAAQIAAELAETNAETAETNAETAETNAEAAQVAAEAAQAAAEAVLTDPNFVTVVGIEADITTVAGIAADVTTVAGISADVTTVAGINQTDLATVAAIDSDVTTVAGISTDVTTVAGIDSDVTAVAGNATNINAVAGNATNINSVAGNATNINAVAGNATNINAVNANSTNINTVATDITNVNSVGNNITNVNSVATNSTNINTVAGNSTNINTVAGISSNVTTVATNNANVTTVATNIASVNTNATNIANINQNAANITAIQNASANATAAANSATAAATSATNAATSAAQASAVALGNEPVRHSVRPSLLLDFANVKTLDPRITFTRGSTATFYDGRTVAKAEENLLLRSQEFETTGVWSLGIGTSRTANTSTAPDGTTTTDTITEDSAASIHNIVQNATSAGQVTFSVFAKAGSGSRFLTISVSRASTHYGSATFNLATQTATQTLIAGYSGSVTTTVTASTQGFFRYSITLTTDTVSDVRIGLSATSTFSNVSRGFDSYTGDGTSSIILWGAQLEQRSSVTAYTATTTGPITNYIPALQTAAANVARFDHNPTTGESLGLLIEESRANLLTRSDDFDNASWVKTRSSVVSNVIIAPDGSLTGDKIIDDTTASSTHLVTQTVSLTAGTYTYSFFAKAGERTFFNIARANGFIDSFSHSFNLTSGTATGTGCSIQSIGNGWYRCIGTVTVNTTGSTGLNYQISNLSGSSTYTGDGYSGIYIWGAQLEAGAFATSYIPTVASQVTRSADAASMTGTNFSSWYRAGEGTVYCEAAVNGYSTAAASAFPTFFVISDNTNNNRINISATNTGSNLYSYFEMNTNNSAQAGLYGLTAQSFGVNTPRKTVVAYKVNDIAFTTVAATVQTDTSANIPVVDRLYFGVGAAGSGNVLNGTIRKLAYYPIRLTSAELQGMTTV